MSRFAQLPDPPYYVVVFSAQRSADDPAYDAMAAEMVKIAMSQPGCLGMESARDPDGFGITNSYWCSEEDIAAWKAQARHRVAQHLGATRWYDSYSLRVARVERAYTGPRTIPD